MSSHISKQFILSAQPARSRAEQRVAYKRSASSFAASYNNSMISHFNCSFLMDWEPAESYGMDVDEKGPVNVPGYIPFSSVDCDVYMVPTTIQEVHMASPILTSQPPIISELAFFLPPLEMKTKPIAFPPFNIHAVSRQALEPHVGPRKITAVSLDDSSFIYTPCVANYQVESPTMANANSQGDTYTSAFNDHNHFLSKSVYRPVTPPPSNSRITFRDVSPILIPVRPIDIPEDIQVADARAATLSPLIESTSYAGWPDGMAGLGDIAPNVDCIPWPDSIDEQDFTPSTPHLVVAEANTPEWIDEQDVTPSTPHPVVAETNAPEWTVDEDVTPLSQYPILETVIPFHWPEITFIQEYVDWGVDLIDLWSSNFDSPSFGKDYSDCVFRVFGGSSLEDLDWILEGFRATSVADASIESKNSSISFEATLVLAPLHNFSPASPYDWAVSEAGPDLISFDSTDDLFHDIRNDSFEHPSFKAGDVIQTESNGLFQTSTPAHNNRSAYEESPDVQSLLPFDSLVIFSKAAYTVERNAPWSTKTDASTQTDKIPVATYNLRPQRRYSPYVRYSPYRKMSRDFPFGSSGSGDLESARRTITSGTSCGLPSPVDNVFLDCSIQATIFCERELEFMEPIPAVHVNLEEPEEDEQKKEMTFPGAYPIGQVKPANLRARYFVKVAQKSPFETEILPSPTVHPIAQYGFKELFFRFFAYFFDW